MVTLNIGCDSCRFFAQTKSRNLRNMQANREQKMMAIWGLN